MSFCVSLVQSFQQDELMTCKQIGYISIKKYSNSVGYTPSVFWRTGGCAAFLPRENSLWRFPTFPEALLCFFSLLFYCTKIIFWVILKYSDDILCHQCPGGILLLKFLVATPTKRGQIFLLVLYHNKLTRVSILHNQLQVNISWRKSFYTAVLSPHLISEIWS